METGKAKQRIHKLNERRRTILRSLMSPKAMIKGSVYLMEKACGNPTCKCARGEKHTGTYLSWSGEGKTGLKYVRKKDIARVTLRTRSYRTYQKLLTELRKIEDEILSLFGQVRDGHVEEYK